MNGCFWHGHPGCKYFVVPKTRAEWWINKISTTIDRDKRIYKELQELNWNVIIIWECQLKSGKKENSLSDLLFTIGGKYE